MGPFNGHANPVECASSMDAIPAICDDKSWCQFAHRIRLQVQPPWSLTIRAPRFNNYVTSYNARFLDYDNTTLKATFQVQFPGPAQQNARA